MTPRFRLIGAGAAILLAGCGNSMEFFQMKQYTPVNSPNPREVYLAPDKATCPHVVVGKVQVARGKASADIGMVQLLPSMQEYAAQLGVSGVENINCGALGTVGQGVCEGDAYVCTR